MFPGKGDMCEAVLETLVTVEHPIVAMCKLIVESCAFAASGSVLQVCVVLMTLKRNIKLRIMIRFWLCVFLKQMQKLLSVCGEHIEDETKSAHQVSSHCFHLFRIYSSSSAHFLCRVSGCRGFGVSCSGDGRRARRSNGLTVFRQPVAIRRGVWWMISHVNQSI